MHILSYNTLAQRYVDPYIETRYKYVNDTTCLTWFNRKALLIEQIEKINADIVCLQEVELETFEDDFLELINKMEYSYNRHIVSKARTSPIGNITIWKNTKYNSTSFIQKSCALINTIVNNETHENIIIANVHLKAGLYNSQPVRKNQLLSILKSTPDIICGDFNDNFKEDGLLYPIIIENRYSIKNDQLTCLVYNEHNKTINWFLFDNVIVKNQIDKIIKINKYNKLKKIPSKKHPSDHLPLIFTIEDTS